MYTHLSYKHIDVHAHVYKYARIYANTDSIFSCNRIQFNSHYSKVLGNLHLSFFVPNAWLVLHAGGSSEPHCPTTLLPHRPSSCAKYTKSQALKRFTLPQFQPEELGIGVLLKNVQV